MLLTLTQTCKPNASLEKPERNLQTLTRPPISSAVQGAGVLETLASGSQPLRRMNSFGPSQKARPATAEKVTVTSSVARATPPVRITVPVDCAASTATVSHNHLGRGSQDPVAVYHEIAAAVAAMARPLGPSPASSAEHAVPRPAWAISPAVSAPWRRKNRQARSWGEETQATGEERLFGQTSRRKPASTAHRSTRWPKKTIRGSSGGRRRASSPGAGCRGRPSCGGGSRARRRESREPSAHKGRNGCAPRIARGGI